MSFALEFLPEAKTDALEAARYYETRVPGLGGRFRSELEKICAAVGQDPLHWRERKGGFRRVNFPSFPFFIAYFIRGERVLVAAVGHASCHPDYWKKRAK